MNDHRRVLRCGGCEAAVECRLEELLRYTREGWPRCCGQVMAVSAEPPPAQPRADR